MEYYNIDDLTEEFFEDLRYIYIESILEDEEATEKLSRDLGEEEVDIEEEVDYREMALEELKHDKDLEYFFSKVRHVEESMASEKSILEDCQTSLVKGIFLAKEGIGEEV